MNTGMAESMDCMHVDPTEDTELEEGDEDELAVDSETGELLESDVDCSLEIVAEGEPCSVCLPTTFVALLAILFHHSCAACLAQQGVCA